MTVLRAAGVIFNMRQRETEAALKVCGSDPFLPPFAPRAPCRGLRTSRGLFRPDRTGRQFSVGGAFKSMRRDVGAERTEPWVSLSLCRRADRGTG